MNKYLKVKFSLNTEYAGEGPSEVVTNSLVALKLLANVWDEDAIQNTLDWDETYFADVEYVSGPKTEFTELRNYLDNL